MTMIGQIFADCERCQEHRSLSCLPKEERNGFASSLSFLWCSGRQLFFLKSYHFHFPSIVSLVAVIYCIVIIYLPSLVEADTNFVVNLHLFFLITIEDFFDKCLFLQGPKRCTTTVIERNITNAFQVKSSGDSNYQGSSSKSQPHLTSRVTHSAPGPLAQSGVSVRWRKMILIQFSSNSTLIPAWDDDLQQDVRDGQRPGSLSQSGTGGFDTYLEKNENVSVRSWGGRRFHVPHLLQRGGSWALQLQEVAIRDLCEWEAAANFIIQRKRFEFPPQDPGDIETCHQFSNLISCKVAWDIFAAFGLSLKIIGDQCLTDGILQKHIEDLGVRVQRQVWIDQRLRNLKSCYNLQPLRLEEEIWWKISSKGTRTVRTVKFWNLWVVPSSYMIYMTPLRDGYCNCNRCPESNVTWVMILHFPKQFF